MTYIFQKLLALLYFLITTAILLFTMTLPFAWSFGTINWWQSTLLIISTIIIAITQEECFNYFGKIIDK